MMDDQMIVTLYWKRSNDAILQTDIKYGKLCYSVSYNILHSAPDSEECVNDTYLRAWNSMPPQRPNNLGSFLCKITRNLSLDRVRFAMSQKRGGGQTALALEELGDCIPSGDEVHRHIEDRELTRLLNTFLAALPKQKRQMFMQRYWYLYPIGDIAENFGISESNVKVTLHRIRRKLKAYLEREGVSL